MKRDCAEASPSCEMERLDSCAIVLSRRVNIEDVSAENTTKVFSTGGFQALRKVRKDRVQLKRLGPMTRNNGNTF